MRERIEKKGMEEELNGKREIDGKGNEERVTERMGEKHLRDHKLHELIRTRE